MKPHPAWSIGYLVFALACLFVIQLLWVQTQMAPESIPYSEFQTSLKEGRIAQVKVSADRIEGTFKEPVANGKKFFVTNRVEPALAAELLSHHVTFASERYNPLWRSPLFWIIPFVVLFALWIFALGRDGQKGGIGGSGLMAIGKSKAKIYVENDIHITFNDVAEVDEAKTELQEVIAFLKTPEKFRRLGGKIPKGILLIGPPGTGKTLLARAVAGEAGVPFFFLSGSEFVEMFVGVGAARVRDLFLQAQEKAPCIIFIDKLDALGKARGMGPVGHEEREQTLNQLLVEMDGFDPRVGIILMAATNRPEILDQALLRAGRFDRQVLVDRPDKRGRLAILHLHARGVALASGANLENIAAMTVGFAGADLANLINEGALLAVRRGLDCVGTAELQDAVERVVAGLEKKNRVLTHGSKGPNDQRHPAKPQAQAAQTHEAAVEFCEGMHHRTAICRCRDAKPPQTGHFSRRGVGKWQRRHFFLMPRMLVRVALRSGADLPVRRSPRCGAVTLLVLPGGRKFPSRRPVTRCDTFLNQRAWECS